LPSLPTVEGLPALPTTVPAAVDGNSPQIATGASPVIYLAGRSDITIPPQGETSTDPLFACRPDGRVLETFPPGYKIGPGAIFTFGASGKVNFYGGEADQGYPPDGGGVDEVADMEAYGGISGYHGPAGALSGVFLDDNIPNGTPPERLDFTPEGLGIDFPRLEPGLGQIFFIGDGKNAAGKPQDFVAPPGATRLYIGMADGSSFVGAPGCYTDNVGSFDFEVHSSAPFEAIK